MKVVFKKIFFTFVVFLLGTTHFTFANSNIADLLKDSNEEYQEEQIKIQKSWKVFYKEDFVLIWKKDIEEIKENIDDCAILYNWCNIYKKYQNGVILWTKKICKNENRNNYCLLTTQEVENKLVNIKDKKDKENMEENLMSTKLKDSEYFDYKTLPFSEVVKKELKSYIPYFIWVVLLIIALLIYKRLDRKKTEYYIYQKEQEQFKWWTIEEIENYKIIKSMKENDEKKEKEEEARKKIEKSMF